jgi:hypothetical protein
MKEGRAILMMLSDHDHERNNSCRNPNLGFATKARAYKACRPRMKLESHISCSQECKRVLGNESPHFQMNSHFGNRSPNGLLNFQRAISGVKIH